MGKKILKRGFITCLCFLVFFLALDILKHALLLKGVESWLSSHSSKNKFQTQLNWSPFHSSVDLKDLSISFKNQTVKVHKGHLSQPLFEWKRVYLSLETLSHPSLTINQLTAIITYSPYSRENTLIVDPLEINNLTLNPPPFTLHSEQIKGQCIYQPQGHLIHLEIKTPEMTVNRIKIPDPHLQGDFALYPPHLGDFHLKIKSLDHIGDALVKGGIISAQKQRLLSFATSLFTDEEGTLSLKFSMKKEGLFLGPLHLHKGFGGN